MQEQVTLDMIRQAREAMEGVVEFTPIVTSARLGKNLYIKSENLQKTGSFKIRGAFNKIRNLTPEEASRGVIACSAGNHAQGVALSATRLGIRSVICMPEGAPMASIFRYVIIFVICMLLVILLLLIFPQIALWLPSILF